MVFVVARSVVRIHRERAEHIVRTHLGYRDVLVPEDALAMPTKTGINIVRQPPQAQQLVIEPGRVRWHHILGWIGILAGAALFVGRSPTLAG